MWIAREESGRLFLFESKPIKSPKCPGLWVNDNVTTPIMEIDKSLFPNLKWEDDPIEVGLKAIPKAKPISQLWEEWRFTNEWKANCQYTTFDQFLIDRGIKYTVE